MASEIRDFVTLGADVGGKDAHAATHEIVLSIRHLLRQKCIGPYSATVKEFALVLRIDGSVQAWGKNGAKNVAFQRRNTFATADIFVPINEWSGRDVAHIRKFIVNGVIDAIELLAELAERKKIDIDIDSLRRDVGFAAREFLG